MCILIFIVSMDLSVVLHIDCRVAPYIYRKQIENEEAMYTLRGRKITDSTKITDSRVTAHTLLGPCEVFLVLQVT